MRGVLADLGVARSLTGVPANPKALAGWDWNRDSLYDPRLQIRGLVLKDRQSWNAIAATVNPSKVSQGALRQKPFESEGPSGKPEGLFDSGPCGVHPRQPVERALQDVSRRHAIDDFGALGA